MRRLVTLCSAMGLISLLGAQDAVNDRPPSSAESARTMAMARATPHISLSDERNLNRPEEYQIRVESDSAETKNAFRFYSREIRSQFYSLLRIRRDDWVVPIKIIVYGNPLDLVEGNYLANEIVLHPDDSFELIFHVKLHRYFEDAEYTREFLRVLVLEQVLRASLSNPVGLAKKKVSVPDWMVYGFEHLIDHQRNGRPSSMFAGVLKNGQLLTVDETISKSNVSTMSPVQRAAFQASSTALIDALLHQPGGRIGMRALIADLPNVGSEKIPSALRQHFPLLREVEDGIEKWWALQVAVLGQMQSFEFFDPERTHQLLEEALIVEIRGSKEDGDPTGKKGNQGIKGAPKTKLRLFEKIRNRVEKGPSKAKEQTEQSANNKPALRAVPSAASQVKFVGHLREFAAYEKFPEMTSALQVNTAKLRKLKQLSFPLYRPLIERYDFVIARIASGKTKGLDEEFAQMDQIQNKIRETMQRTRDYLNYFEATSAPQKSDSFQDYTKLRRSLDKAKLPARKDRIAEYLDILQSEFEP